ncbi:MAG: divalent-cation tolerance protein CutA [Alphaproteobacteria bacterium]|nr:divalent-cation tolerance protein CutA [Alphaproteobacteria bacterium]
MAAWSLYLTAATQAEAEKISRTLVEERLAACANVLGPIRSFYWWQGQVQDEGEVAFLLKTSADLVDRVVARVKELHSYSVPCVVSWPIDAGNPDYLAWVESETRKV